MPKTTIHVPDAIWTRARQKALPLKRSMGEIITDLLSKWLQREGDQLVSEPAPVVVTADTAAAVAKRVAQRRSVPASWRCSDARFDMSVKGQASKDNVCLNCGKKRESHE